jgi:dTDP-L-rhamnose 4-epimerase
VLEPVATHESAPLHPTSVYGITKRDQEELVLVVGRAYGLESVALRYLNVYGPRQALANPYTGVAAIFAARLLNGRRPLVFEDGRQIRDLVHVSDVVRATRAAMDAAAAPGHAINVATGMRVRIAELARELARALGSALEPEITGDFRAGDIRHCFADTARARELLGFDARVRPADGLPELAEWVGRQTVTERGDDAVRELRERGLVG